MSTTEKLTIGVQYPDGLITDPVIYVDDIKGNDNNNGNETSPVKTLYKASEILQNGYKGTATINVIAGSDIALDDDLVLNGMSEGLIINCSENKEDTGTADGGTDQTSAPTTFAFATVVDSSQTWIVDQFVGMRIEFTSGPLSGYTSTISSNTADTIVLLSDPTTAPTTEGFTITSRANNFILSDMTLRSKGTVTINFIELSSTSISTVDVEDQLLLVGCGLISGGIIATKGPGILGFGSISRNILSTTPVIGGFVDLGTTLVIGCNQFVNGAVYGSINDIEYQTATFIQTNITATAIDLEDQSLITIDRAICAGPLTIRRNSQIILEDITFTVTVSNCVTVSDSTLFISNLKGSTTAVGTFGLSLLKNSIVRKNVASTVTGTTGDVSLGAVGTKTWVLIDGGLAANTSDYGAVSPTYVLIQ